MRTVATLVPRPREGDERCERVRRERRDGRPAQHLSGVPACVPELIAPAKIFELSFSIILK